MAVATNAKELVYSSIDEIGRSKIRLGVVSDIRMSKYYIREIVEKCQYKQKGLNFEALSAVCEVLLHFMLSTSGLPSERRISFLEGINLDIVIPSLRQLKKDSRKSLIIQVVKTVDETDRKIQEAKTLQPDPDNIWLISTCPLIAGYRNYHLKYNQKFPYYNVIIDINAFLKNKDVDSLPFLQI